MVKRSWIVTVILIVLGLIGCVSLNENPPNYIKSVVAYKEGPGLAVYFVLADINGAMTTSDGRATLIISETKLDWDSQYFENIERESVLYSNSFVIQKNNFCLTKVGIGAFEHNVILYSFGRIAYSSFRKQPTEMFGKIKLIFQKPDGQIIEGEDSVLF